MADEPNFEELRAQRNADFIEGVKRIRKELGWGDDEPVSTTFDPNACYCACPTGPCEHRWDGPEWVSENGCASSCTCSRCGTTAMSHSLRICDF